MTTTTSSRRCARSTACCFRAATSSRCSICRASGSPIGPPSSGRPPRPFTAIRSTPGGSNRPAPSPQAPASPDATMSTLPAEAMQGIEEGAPITAEGLLRRRARQRPGVVALSDPPNLPALGFGRPRSLTYREADDAVDALASFFIELGLEPGDRIAVQFPNLVLPPLTL